MSEEVSTAAPKQNIHLSFIEHLSMGWKVDFGFRADLPQKYPRDVIHYSKDALFSAILINFGKLLLESDLILSRCLRLKWGLRC